MTPQEQAARIYADGILARMGMDHGTVIAKYTLLSRTEDYIAEIIPLLEPYLGPAETWIATLIPGGPLVDMLTLLLMKAAAAGAEKWSANRLASEAK